MIITLYSSNGEIEIMQNVKDFKLTKNQLSFEYGNIEQITETRDLYFVNSIVINFRDDYM